MAVQGSLHGTVAQRVVTQGAATALPDRRRIRVEDRRACSVGRSPRSGEPTAPGRRCRPSPPARPDPDAQPALHQWPPAGERDRRMRRRLAPGSFGDSSSLQRKAKLRADHLALGGVWSRARAPPSTIVSPHGYSNIPIFRARRGHADNSDIPDTPSVNIRASQTKCPPFRGALPPRRCRHILDRATHRPHRPTRVFHDRAGADRNIAVLCQAVSILNR
jgi:hypothetical protein